ncbi:TetR/AcrR family transcriptional regulator [Rhodococcus phenolicus]|uniref:TetR/AcrR family transcriptional regulator n=1 Tax=Rhodococcus phenolicus TaxID=263849 RepID=UPI00082AF392|nr:TetR/AcrR family transcriptional regulator [Rhodococcus phenolicus]
MPRNWNDDERTRAAEARLLEVAEHLFTERGVDKVTMADIAAAAGCSRATLYRYFPTRNDLSSAYIRTTTERILRDIMDETASVDAAADRTTRAVTAAIRAIRDDPALGPWFEPDAGLPAKTAVSHTAVAAALETFLARHTEAEPDRARLADTARWLTRTIIGLVVMPEAGPEDEAAYIERFVTPVLLTASSTARTRDRTRRRRGVPVIKTPRP